MFEMKMAQVDGPKKPESPFGAPNQSWTDEDVNDPSQTVTDKSTAPITPDDDSQSIAQEFMGKMTRIGPNLYLDDSTASTLSACKALGLPMNSKEEILNIAGLFEDDTVLLEHISWFNEQEWQMLLQWISKLASHVAVRNLTLHMAYLYTAAGQIDQDELQLLLALHDLKFEIRDGSLKTPVLLRLLADSKSQSAQIAAKILAKDPASLSELFTQFETQVYGPQPGQQTTPSSGAPVPVKQPFPSPEFGKPEMKPLQDLMRTDPALKGYGVPKAPQVKTPTPSTAPSNPELQMTMPEVNKFGVDPVAHGVNGGGAVAKGKQMAAFTHNYEDYAKGLPPDVKAAPYGTPIPRQYVFPAGGGTKGGGGLANVPVTGGMFLKDNKNGLDAMAIGSAPGGLLAVRLFPSGEYDQWDLMSNPVEVSRNRPPKREF